MIVTLSWKTLLALLGDNISPCYRGIDSNDRTFLLDINRFLAVTSNCVTVVVCERSNSGVAALRHRPSSMGKARIMQRMLFVLQIRRNHLMQSAP